MTRHPTSALILFHIRYVHFTEEFITNGLICYGHCAASSVCTETESLQTRSLRLTIIFILFFKITYVIGVPAMNVVCSQRNTARMS